ncbi:MAG: hypothetical protein ACPGJV_01085 [Bacteriovoracaceae bacterium]
MIIIPLRVIFFFFLTLFFLESDSFAQEEDPARRSQALKYEKETIIQISKTFADKRESSLLRVIEINSELIELNVDNSEFVSQLYEETEKITLFIKKKYNRTPFYSKALLRWAAINHFIGKNQRAIEILSEAHQYKNLEKKEYLISLQISIRAYYQKKNFKKVAELVSELKSYTNDELAPELILLYARSLFSIKRFQNALSSLQRYIDYLQNQSNQNESHLTNIHLFFVEANEYQKGINFLSKKKHSMLPKFANYAISSKQNIRYADRAIQEYLKVEKTNKKRFYALIRFVKTLNNFKFASYSTPYLIRAFKIYRSVNRDKEDYSFLEDDEDSRQRTGRSSLLEKEDLTSLLKVSYQTVLLQKEIGTSLRNMTDILSEIDKVTDNLKVFNTFLLAKIYYKRGDNKLALKTAREAFSMVNDPDTDLGGIRNFKPAPNLDFNKAPLTQEILNQIVLITEIDKSEKLKPEQTFELYQQYINENSEGEYLDDVYIALLKEFLSNSKLDQATFLILEYLQNHPERYEVLAPFIDQLSKLISETDLPIETRNKIINDPNVRNKVFESVSDEIQFQRCLFLYKIGLSEYTIELFQSISPANMKDKTRFYLTGAQIYLENLMNEDSMELLEEFIRVVSPKELPNVVGDTLELIKGNILTADRDSIQLVLQTFIKKYKRTIPQNLHVDFFEILLMNSQSPKSLAKIIRRFKLQVSAVDIFSKFKEFLFLNAESRKLAFYLLDLAKDKLQYDDELVVFLFEQYQNAKVLGEKVTYQKLKKHFVSYSQKSPRFQNILKYFKLQEFIKTQGNKLDLVPLIKTKELKTSLDIGLDVLKKRYELLKNVSDDFIYSEYLINAYLRKISESVVRIVNKKYPSIEEKNQVKLYENFMANIQKYSLVMLDIERTYSIISEDSAFYIDNPYVKANRAYLQIAPIPFANKGRIQ